MKTVLAAIASTRRWLLLALTIALTACGGGGGGDESDTAALRDRAPNTPDVILFSFSGHDGPASALLCTSGGNAPYLGDPSELGGALAIAQKLRDLGNSVQEFHCADLLDGRDIDLSGEVDVNGVDVLGFRQALALLALAHDDLIDGVRNPTRIVLVGHSHGGSWAHLATALLPQIPIDYLVTLDGICFLWECEHAVEVEAFLNSFPASGLGLLAYPCDSVAVEGTAKLYNLKDVVLPHVQVNLEVQSSDLFTDDATNNVRLDGTAGPSVGLGLFVSPENHDVVDNSDSAAIAWVLQMLEDLETR